MTLREERCVACRPDTPAVSVEELKTLKADLETDWQIVRPYSEPGDMQNGYGAHLRRAFHFKNFKDALAFVNRLGDLAEQEHHHPDVLLSWGRVGVDLTTHTIDGLTRNDFIVAAKIDALAAGG